MHLRRDGAPFWYWSIVVSLVAHFGGQGCSMGADYSALVHLLYLGLQRACLGRQLGWSRIPRIESLAGQIVLVCLLGRLGLHGSVCVINFIDFIILVNMVGTVVGCFDYLIDCGVTRKNRLEGGLSKGGSAVYSLGDSGVPAFVEEGGTESGGWHDVGQLN